MKTIREWLNADSGICEMTGRELLEETAVALLVVTELALTYGFVTLMAIILQ